VSRHNKTLIFLTDYAPSPFLFLLLQHKQEKERKRFNIFLHFKSGFPFSIFIAIHDVSFKKKLLSSHNLLLHFLSDRSLVCWGSFSRRRFPQIPCLRPSLQFGSLALLISSHFPNSVSNLINANDNFGNGTCFLT